MVRPHTIRAMRTRLLAATLALALGAAACGGDDAGTAAPSNGSSSGRVDDGAVLDFRAQSVDGSTVDVDSLRGTDVVIWFWAPW